MLGNHPCHQAPRAKSSTCAHCMCVSGYSLEPGSTWRKVDETRRKRGKIPRETMRLITKMPMKVSTMRGALLWCCLLLSKMSVHQRIPHCKWWLFWTMLTSCGQNRHIIILLSILLSCVYLSGLTLLYLGAYIFQYFLLSANQCQRKSSDMKMFNIYRKWPYQNAKFNINHPSLSLFIMKLLLVINWICIYSTKTRKQKML